jgi:hypothetical protein
MAYATTEEFRLYVKHDDPFTTQEQDTAALLLDLATGAVDDEIGQSLELSTDPVLLDGSGTRKLVLPRWPVTAVSEVTLADTGEVLVHGKGEGYTWSAAGLLFRQGGCWPCDPQAVSLMLTAGHATAPAGVKRIVLRLAGGSWLNTAGALSAETLGDHSATYATPADAGIELSETDKRALGVYRART